MPVASRKLALQGPLLQAGRGNRHVGLRERRVSVTFNRIVRRAHRDAAPDWTFDERDGSPPTAATVLVTNDRFPSTALLPAFERVTCRPFDGRQVNILMRAREREAVADRPAADRHRAGGAPPAGRPSASRP